MNDMNLLNTALTVLTSVLASSGLWAFFMSVFNKKDAKASMLLGLAHDRIIELGITYIERGWITQDEYEKLHDYLYKPYEALGGNGTGKRIMDEVKKLPIKPVTCKGVVVDDRNN